MENSDATNETINPTTISEETVTSTEPASPSEKVTKTASPEVKDEQIGLIEGAVFPHSGVGRLMEIVRVTRVVVHYRVAGEPDTPSWVLGRTDFLNMFGEDLIVGHPYTPIPAEMR